MRYIVQLLIPALIVIGVALVLLRNRNSAGATRSAAKPADGDDGTLSTATFVLILVIGATFTVALIYALHTLGS